MVARTIALCSAGAIAGIILVLACGDDSPNEADAASVCDCPEAEPPLSGRIVLEEHTGTIHPGVDYSAAACDQVGDTFPPILSGGCRIVDSDVKASGEVQLVDSFRSGADPETQGWTCTFHNGTADDVEVMVTLTCLQPASASN